MNNIVFIHYYTWYSAPPVATSYGHWDGGGLLGTPQDIAAPFYPLVSPYDSSHPAVLLQHMVWMKVARVDVIINSWWGQGSREDNITPSLLDAAAAAGLNVCFQIEPYANRTLPRVVADIGYLYGKYGHHPAFYKVSRPTLAGTTLNPRGVFFLYEAPGGIGTVTAMDSLRGTANDAIVLGRMDDSLLSTDADVRRQLSFSHFDGLYNYGAAFPDTRPFPRSNDYILVYSVLPGWDHTRIPPFHDTAQQGRNDGQYYDTSWAEMVRQKPEGVAIISFNEWHEGGQIEPAKPFQHSGFTYHDYEHAYGLTGNEASLAYIARTALWVQQYKT